MQESKTLQNRGLVADRFEHEVEALRNSQRFQTFLDERLACQTRMPLEELEQEVDEELTREGMLSAE